MKLKLYAGRLGQAGESTCYKLGQRMQGALGNAVTADGERSRGDVRTASLFMEGVRRHLRNLRRDIEVSDTPLRTRRPIEDRLRDAEKNAETVLDALKSSASPAKRGSPAVEAMNRLFLSLQSLDHEIGASLCTSAAG